MSLREKLDAGLPILGGWCVIPSSVGAELMGRAGFDYVCVDNQHGLIGYDQTLPMLQALSVTGTPSLVRVSWNQPGEIMKALDAGAQGVIVPMVNTPEEARAAVGACRYPPAGFRSWGPTRASLGVSGYSPATANQGVVCAIMIETATAIADLDEILTVPGIDAVYVGPNDLAVTSGLPPSADVTDPEHHRLVLTILEACLRHGIVPGIHCGSVATARRWREAGFKMLTLHSDALLLRQSAAAGLQAMRGEPAAVPSKGGYA